MAIFWCLIFFFFLYEMPLLAHCTLQILLYFTGLWFSRGFSEHYCETISSYRQIFNTVLVGCGEKQAKSLQLAPCWIFWLSSAIKTTWALTPSPKIVELMNSSTLLSVKGLGLCPQGEKLGGKLTAVYLEKKAVLLLCVLTGTHLPQISVFLFASTLLS